MVSKSGLQWASCLCPRRYPVPGQAKSKSGNILLEPQNSTPPTWVGLALPPLLPGLELPSPNHFHLVRSLLHLVFKRHLQCLPVALFQSCRPQGKLGPSSHLLTPGTLQAGRPGAPGYFLATDCLAEAGTGSGCLAQSQPPNSREPRLFTSTPSPLLWRDKAGKIRHNTPPPPNASYVPDLHQQLGSHSKQRGARPLRPSALGPCPAYSGLSDNWASARRNPGRPSREATRLPSPPRSGSRSPVSGDPRPPRSRALPGPLPGARDPGRRVPGVGTHSPGYWGPRR